MAHEYIHVSITEVAVSAYTMKFHPECPSVLLLWLFPHSPLLASLVLMDFLRSDVTPLTSYVRIFCSLTERNQHEINTNILPVFIMSMKKYVHIFHYTIYINSEYTGSINLYILIFIAMDLHCYLHYQKRIK